MRDTLDLLKFQETYSDMDVKIIAKEFSLSEKQVRELSREIDSFTYELIVKESQRRKDRIKITSDRNIFTRFITNFLRPSLYIQKIYDLNIDMLKEWGTKLVLCDLDNTLVPHFTKLPTGEAINFVKKIRELGIIFVLVSNNTKKRVEVFAEKLGVDDYVSNAKKPFTKQVKKVLSKYENIKSNETVLMGDQIITDILVANFLKIESILVSPMLMSDYKFKRFQSWIEKQVFRRLEKQNLLTKPSTNFNEESYELL